MSVLNVYDALNAKLEWVDEFEGYYRVNVREGRERDEKELDESNQNELKSYEEYDNYEMEDDYEIERLDNGRFKVKLDCPHTFYSYIIGSKGSRRKQLEAETGTTIAIPRTQEDKTIVITGQREQFVERARHRLQMIIINLRAKHNVTHFISIPMVSEEIRANFLKFKTLVLQKKRENVDESIFMKKDKLHLTLGTLKLLDDDEKESAGWVLDACRAQIVEPYLKKVGHFDILMKGLEYMNDDPSEVDVLYGKVQVLNNDAINILQEISNRISQYFEEKGYKMRENYGGVKLHVTLMNTRYRTESDETETKLTKRIPFDAREILAQYSDFEFGIQKFQTIHISDRGAVDKEGYYNPVWKIDF